MPKKRYHVPKKQIKEAVHANQAKNTTSQHQLSKIVVNTLYPVSDSNSILGGIITWQT
ncbi:hypothetical protein [Vallitalea guaymasensis]|uniref:hypothetical protein n=1 Tax=Vallitalea guaymasensis TaxID=1185412 RepID=UPI002729655D|nr:hypothetical protein [Vallitalea guaymasensis]